MGTTAEAIPLVLVQFRLRGKNGQHELVTRTSDRKGIEVILQRLSVDLVFDVQLHCNGVLVGNATYHKQHNGITVEHEDGACISLLKAFVQSFDDSQDISA